ncbi:MAG: type II toxin-antitoxin system RelE/ParE family toxin [Kangiellaceae bacterium]|nr:type II toxin-antitoxin system RelE/ParE family toxin [Kangiellaceae bacterium]
MIKTFSDRYTKALYETGKSRKFPPDILSRASRKLEYVNLAYTVDDLKVPPGNKLHQLTNDRVGQHAIVINDQWRICFKFEDGDAFDVEVCDYH